MKLTVSDIRFSASSPVNVFATIDVESGKSLSPICSISVTVPMVEGKALEQYKDELLAKARELIAEIYKEIVCGGELDEEINIPLSGKLSGKFNIRVVNKNGKPSVAGLVGEASDMLDCFCGKIEPSELSKETLEQIHSAQLNNDLEGRIAAQSIIEKMRDIVGMTAKEHMDNWRLSKSTSTKEEVRRYNCAFDINITD
ncbi:hypothetical protein DNL97_12935 [Salmonella enterica subsp. enterica serovar Oranienburg]|nr:hypothetical protein [Salmonella enterica subsp. enterica serovar Oranienburg]EDL5727683.1 hypothetical protein [Salmonella enterica subsp. enterica serovar Adelaide]